MKSAAKVGVLLVVFVALIIASFGVLGKSLFAPRRQTFYADLADAGGVTTGTRVLMAGVQIGTVDKIELKSPHLARFTMRLKEGIGIPAGSEVVIPSSIVGLGESPVEIHAPAQIAANLPEGATLQGRKAGPLDNLLPNGGRDLYAHVNQTLVSVQKLLQDQRLQHDLRKLLETSNITVAASRVTLQKFDALATRTDRLIAQSQGNIASAIASTRGAIEQVRYTAGELARFVREGKLQRSTTAILDHAVHIEKQASDLLANLDKTLGNQSLRNDISATARNVKAATDAGPQIAANAQKITANVADITESAKPLPATINEVAKKASALEDRINALIDKVNGIKPPNTNQLKLLSTELDEIRESGQGHWRTDINGSLPTHDGFITFGLYDAFETNRLNLQVGRTVSRSLDYRYGAYASKPGVGVDYALSPRLGVRTDLWDVNSPEFDARLKYDFGGGVIGWAGFERIFSKSSPAFGLGIRR